MKRARLVGEDVLDLAEVLRERAAPRVREALGLGVVHGHVPVHPLGVQRAVELEVDLERDRDHEGDEEDEADREHNHVPGQGRYSGDAGLGLGPGGKG